MALDLSRLTAGVTCLVAANDVLLAANVSLVEANAALVSEVKNLGDRLTAATDPGPAVADQAAVDGVSGLLEAEATKVEAAATVAPVAVP